MRADGKRTRVLVVDDSAIVRRVLTDILSGEPDIEVVGSAPDPYIARDKIMALQPDVLTLDLEMPRMDGLTFLSKLMEKHPLPVIVISSLAEGSAKTALEALRRGAVEVLGKPRGPFSVGDLKAELPALVRAAAAARRPSPARPPVPVPPTSLSANAVPAATIAGPEPAGRIRAKLLAIGASTGGTQAIESVLKALPGQTPPIVIVQHIPAVFSTAFANRLAGVCRIRVREAQDGDRLEPNLALVAPGNFHMRVERLDPLNFCVRLDQGPKVCYQRPAVDILFDSVARHFGSDAIGVLLTGMGKDGAEGMLAMRRKGAHTIAQDEASSVVFGMPREAIKLKAAEKVLPLGNIAGSLLGQMPA